MFILDLLLRDADKLTIIASLELQCHFLAPGKANQRLEIITKMCFLLTQKDFS